MPGYEDLTPDQLIQIVNQVSIILQWVVVAIMVYSTALIIRSVLLYKATKKLEGRVEKIIMDVVSDKPKSLLKDFQEYREKRKKQKEEKELARL